MPNYRSRTSTHGRNMAGARALWRATGMQDGDFGKPIIAVVNSFTQFVPGHVHLKDLGQLVAREIEAAGGVAKEFNTIAIDDGIAMGHDGMLYSLPSRDLIADSVEYMVNAHCADAMVCISNCDKITPGMLMAAMRVNIPTIFVSGGPMEARKVKWGGKVIAVDIEPKMIERVSRRAQTEGVTNLEGKVADVYNLPFGDGAFDAIYLITVISEIPEPERAMQEFHRLLAPSGVLAFRELLTDPDYPLAQTLVRLADQAQRRAFLAGQSFPEVVQAGLPEWSPRCTPGARPSARQRT